MGHKRKRQSESAVIDEPVSKKQVTEKRIVDSAAERRQKRSERKSRKTQPGRQKGSRDNFKQKSKYEPDGKSKSKSKSKSQVAAKAPELVKATPATDDSLAEGQDFISLIDSTERTPRTNSDLSPNPSKQSTPKSKRASPRSERKKAKTEKAQASTLNGSDPSTASNTNATTSPTSTTTPRFIAFVGNLPYSTTTPQITSHFRKLTPASIRHPTDKSTGKSKGYAFLEFDNYSAMKTCLKVYHHSMFDPERTSKLPDDAFDEDGLEIVKPGQERKGSGRRINVELTAGGGGKGDGRKEKIRVKNTRLEEQRDRRREAEVKAEKAKSRKKGISQVNQVDVQEKVDDGRGDIHPSRLKRVKA